METGPEWSPFYASMGGTGRCFHARTSCHHVARSGATAVQLTWERLSWHTVPCGDCAGGLRKILEKSVNRNAFYAELRDGKIDVAGGLSPRDGQRRRREERDGHRDTKRAKTDS